ncbi:response regulator [Colwelliaceae bacterium 6471]
MKLTCQRDLNDFSQLNVLVIDDNRLVHDFLKSTFYSLGFQNVRCAENAYYGLRLCGEMHFNIIICAFNIKSDKDGFHLLEELKFKGYVKKTTILIFLSTETDESLVNSIVELQPDDFWVKPLIPKMVQKRLLYTLEIKKQLFNIYHAIDSKEFSKVIYYADRHLLDKKLSKYHANILRMKGDALINLVEYKEAESFYKSLMEKYDYAWVHVGYVRSLLKQGRIEEIHALIEQLANKPSTRFATHDMLAQYYLEQEHYDLAYDEIQKATALSPRNIERNKKSWDLARLNHDHMGQYVATRSIAKYAKNSIHDSPVLLLNVIRAGIDLACTITDDSSNKILEQSERYIHELETEYDDASEFKQQLIVIKARIHNAREESDKAEKLVENHMSLQPSHLIEDNLDKVKVLHELGMREEAIALLAVIKKQISGDSLASEVVGKYVEQETDERSEIHFTPKQLNSMAVEFFQKNKLQPALDSVAQALKLAPKNVKLLFSLFKILIVMKEQDDIDESHHELANNIIDVLTKLNLDEKKQDVFDGLKVKWTREKATS